MPRFRENRRDGLRRENDEYDSYRNAPPPPRYPPPPPPPPARDSYEHQSYRPQQRADDKPRGPYSELRYAANGSSQNYARDHRDNARPPQGEFSFRSDAPAGVQSNLNLNDSYRPSDRANGYRGGDSYRDDRYRGRAPRGRGGYNSHRGRGGFRPNVHFAHERLLLHKKHTEDAELMLGDTKSRATFRSIDSLSDSDEAAMEISGDSDSDETGERPSKRSRLEDSFQAPVEQAPPRWSNPDPYDALPPPDQTQHKKRDVLQMIRKSRVDAEIKTSMSADGADFISFDTTDDDSPKSNEKSKFGSGNTSPGSFNKKEKKEPVVDAQQDVVQMPSEARTGLASLPPRPPIAQPPPALKMHATPPKKVPDLEPSTALGNRKRTHDDQIKLPHALLAKVTKLSSDGGVVPFWAPKPHEDVCPWARIDHSDTANMGVRLHKELTEFYEYLKPRDFEVNVRTEMVSKINEIIKRRWSDAEVKAFGSFKSGLFLPTADMDLVVCSNSFLRGGLPKYDKKPNLFQLRGHLTNQKVPFRGHVEVIPSAKVPLIKFCDSSTGLKVDVSFEKMDGVNAIQTFLAWKERYSVMPKLVSSVKHFLCMRGLNEPVNGGIGGFSVICMVVHFLDMDPRIQSRSMNPEHHMGELFMGFLDYFGHRFNYPATAIRLNPPGVVNKNELQNFVYRHWDRLSIIDPNNQNNDIAGGSSNFPQVVSEFRAAYETLRLRMEDLQGGKSKPFHGYSTLLAPLFAGDYSSMRHQRDYLERMDREGVPDSIRKSTYWDASANPNPSRAATKISRFPGPGKADHRSRF